MQGHRGAAAGNTTTEQAKQICGNKSIVSKGARLPTGPEHTSGHVGLGHGRSAPVPATDRCGVPVRVTAFNGTKKNTLFLHSRAETSVNNTTVLVGKLKKGPKGFGKPAQRDDPAARSPARSAASRRP